MEAPAPARGRYIQAQAQAQAQGADAATFDDVANLLGAAGGDHGLIAVVEDGERQGAAEPGRAAGDEPGLPE
ncbi:hypothetical protein [Nonomuraea sp. NPDC049695]|uniref:hypothetical protein n=1 Tax=Nonomuraea sp. NPDC049695 TaxID=3154734 RepID=UPI003416AC65